MKDATVGALAGVPVLVIPAVATVAPVDLSLTAIERDRVAYVAFVASLNGTDGRKAAQEKGRGGRGSAVMGTYPYLPRTAGGPRLSLGGRQIRTRRGPPSRPSRQCAARR
jgi:hypothetical protein